MKIDKVLHVNLITISVEQYDSLWSRKSKNDIHTWVIGRRKGQGGVMERVGDHW